MNIAHMGAYLDPESLVFMVKKPDGSILTFTEITRADKGHYYYDIVPDIGGTWHYRWVTKNPTAAKEHNFKIRKSEFS